MYKKRIAQWGLDRRNKEMRAIVRKHTQRATEGKPSQTRVRGKLIDFGEVLRYWERKGISIDDVIARRTSSPTPEAVKCFTPMSSPVTTPESLARPEQIFTTICNYCNGCFDAGTWVGKDPQRSCYSVKCHGEMYHNVTTFLQLNETAGWLFDIDAPQEPLETMVSADALIGKILFAEDPDTLLAIFRTVLRMFWSRRPEISAVTLRQFSALAETILGENHPFCLVCGWLVSMSPIQWEDVIAGAFQALGDRFEKILGPMHQTTLETRQRRILSCPTRSVGPEQSAMQDLWYKCIGVLGPYDSRTLYVHFAMVEQFWNNGSFLETKQWSQSLVASAEQVQRFSYSKYYSAEGLLYLACSEWELQARTSAITHIRAAIDVRISPFGADDARVLPWFVILEKWLSEQGQFREAAEVRARRRAMMRPGDIV